MANAKQGDTVKVHYIGRLDDGTIFDSSGERPPLEFELGAGQLISGFEQAVDGMSIGDKKTVKIASDDAYGPRFDELVKIVERTAIPDDVDIELGTKLEASGPDQDTLVLTVVEMNDESVTLDANHPLAGQDLTFDIELVEIG